jgi:hypothetical protein
MYRDAGTGHDRFSFPYFEIIGISKPGQRDAEDRGDLLSIRLQRVRPWHDTYYRGYDELSDCEKRIQCAEDVYIFREKTNLLFGFT